MSEANGTVVNPVNRIEDASHTGKASKFKRLVGFAAKNAVKPKTVLKSKTEEGTVSATLNAIVTTVASAKEEAKDTGVKFQAKAEEGCGEADRNHSGSFVDAEAAQFIGLLTGQ